MSLEDGTIDGSPIVYTFTILHIGWEMDNYGWVTQDGKVWTTNHGNIHEIKKDQIVRLMEAPIKSLNGINAALEMIKVKDGNE